MAACIYRFNTLGDVLGGFHNDEFLVISKAAQMLRGDLPVRDFFDPGTPLAYVMTAGAMKLFGYHLGAEAIVTVVALAVGAALCVWLTSHATGSLLAAVVAATLAVLTGPRYYNYPKIALYAIALVLMWRYVDVPRRGRLVALALLTVVAFLFRHDHGAYIAVLSAFTVAVSVAPHWRSAAPPMAAYAAITVLFAAPYLLYLQWHAGVPEYLRSISSWAARDMARTQLSPPVFRIDWRAPLFVIHDPAPSPLPAIKIRWQPAVSNEDRARLEQRYGLEALPQSEGSYRAHDASGANLEAIVRDPLIADTHGVDRTLFVITEPPTEPVWSRLRREHAWLRVQLAPGFARRENGLPFLYQLARWMPLAALATLVLARRRVAAVAAGWPNAHRKVLILIALTALLTFVFLRGSLESRIADISIPVAILGAWLAIVHARPSLGGWVALRLPVVVLLVLMTVLSINAEARVVTELQRPGIMFGPAAIARRMALVWNRLSESPPLPAVVSPGEPPVFPLARYVRRCTVSTDRVFGVTFLPELYFYAQRGFAAGLLTVMPGFLTSPEEQQTAITHLESQSVPIVITEDAATYASVFRREFPLLTAHIDTHYRDAGTLNLRSVNVRVLVRRDRSPSAVDSSTGLPCFQS